MVMNYSGHLVSCQIILAILMLLHRSLGWEHGQSDLTVIDADWGSNDRAMDFMICLH